MTGDQTAFFAPIVTLTGPLESVIEFGPNVGLNLSALRRIFPEIEVAGVEVNQGACAELKRNIPDAVIYQCPADRFETERTYDLALTKSFHPHSPAGTGCSHRQALPVCSTVATPGGILQPETRGGALPQYCLVETGLWR